MPLTRTRRTLLTCAFVREPPTAPRVTSHDRTARIWDAATGQPVGWQLDQLPDSELAIWSSPEHELLGASDGAWRWLGWLVPQDGRLVRLPAETWGPLPPLDPPTATPL